LILSLSGPALAADGVKINDPVTAGQLAAFGNADQRTASMRKQPSSKDHYYPDRPAFSTCTSQ
jgi:hypothetical protein